ncbi:hypothetical protein BJ960_000465 [Leucobacter aridicollis]|uniref:Uncharacterized protein n=1 Tax=Leucobacter aridicollis TaxID=283878 RepID=A0A852RG31_9MICO|nr:hypothetical protein [Leucobacter aridicollis]
MSPREELLSPLYVLGGVNLRHTDFYVWWKVRNCGEIGIVPD